MHLREGVGCDGYLIPSGDLPGLQKTGLSPAEEDDGIILTALAGLPDDGQTGRGDEAKLLPVLNRPIAVWGERTFVQVPVNVIQQMLNLIIVP